ncbi:hypothetical protein [Arthrobacter tumbae]|uniref:hypothetical protein n=1 Tax=Arthrobacter tumbae TaxID=163874 RepID=UPI00195B00EC|nr:hypothetical protein [Arthrobacter tumbae]MBM7781166.1 hypothetical protein [Arthrobacter tumbae]
MDQRTAVAERLTAAVRASAVEDDAGARDVEHALAFLGELDLQTLQEIERELGREDSLINHPVLGIGNRGLAAFLGRRFAASISTSQYHFATPVPRIRANLLDTLVFRDILRAHGNTMFNRVTQGVKKALGLPEPESLAEIGFAGHGPANIFLLLDVAASFATVQFRRTSVTLDGVRGPEGMDLYADALDNCHFMTTAFARFLLKSQPSSEMLCKATERGRLDGFGVSPTDIDLERLSSELEKLRSRLPELAAAYASWAPGGDTAHRLPPPEAGQDDDARMVFTVLEPKSRPRTAGEANEQRLIRRNWSVRLREHRNFLVPGSAVLSGAWYLLFIQATSQDLSIRVGLLAAVLGALVAAALLALIDAREAAFFRAATALSKYTVLQGHRDNAFLAALRKVRPDAFGASKYAGLPRNFTVMAQREGVALLGLGVRPNVVAAFHWIHLPAITAPPNSPASSARSSHRVALMVRHDGEKVELSFPLERAKVAWTQRNFLENKPMEAVLSMLQGMRTNWTMPPLGSRYTSDTWDVSERFDLLRSANVAGTTYEREVLDWEFGRRDGLVLDGAEELHRTQRSLKVALAALLFGIFIIVPVLTAAN